MSRKNKTLRAFLHKTEAPTIEQAWDCAWSNGQKTFHSRSMQDSEKRIEELESALQKCKNYFDFSGKRDQTGELKNVADAVDEVL